MKKALILGFSGSFGLAMTKELLAQNYEVTALIRNEAHKQLLSSEHLHFEMGDIHNKELLDELCQNNDIVVYGINMPYADWQEQAEHYLQTVLNSMQQSNARFIFPGNIYAYADQDGLLIDEQTPKTSPTFLSQVRFNMEDQLKKASKQGLNIMIIRAGNYFGEHAPSGWLTFLIKQKNQQVQVSCPGNPHAKLCYAYLPDLAKNTVQLLNQDLDVYEEFCFKGHEFSFNELKQQIESQTSLTANLVKFNWTVVKLMSLFIRKMKHLDVTQYLFNKQILLNDNKLHKKLGNKPYATDLIVALKKSKLIE